MKKKVLSILTFFISLQLFCAAAFASESDTVRVGLFYSGSSSNDALISANLENYKDTGSGYYFGYYDQNRDFVQLGQTDEIQISVSQDLNLSIDPEGKYTTEVIEGASMIGCFHIQLTDAYESFDAAQADALVYRDQFGTAFPVYDRGSYYVRIGNFTKREDAEAFLAAQALNGAVNSGTSYTLTVTKTKTNQILFEYDGGGETFLAIEPRPNGTEKAQTWFKGYRYFGGFEYDRAPELSDGKINVLNVVDLEDYVKGVITFEMSASWPKEALKAQAVCARTYALNQHKHDNRGFDVCNTTNCQVYKGTAASDPNSDAAVDETAGLEIYYQGAIIDTPYYSSNGGATENSENVWYTKLPYLRGKPDPYEATITIPGYAYEKSYTTEELTALLQRKGHNIGTVASVTAEYTEMGNMYALTFTDVSGQSVVVKKENCKFLFSVPSMRFTVTGSDGVSGGAVSPTPPEAQKPTLKEFFVNTKNTILQTILGVHTISGSGIRSTVETDTAYVITANGKELLGASESVELPAPDSSNSGIGTVTTSGSTYVVRGTGNGHNVGMSQFGAYAMAKQGLTYEDILHFYYTDITIE